MSSDRKSGGVMIPGNESDSMRYSPRMNYV
jgi:hypothetical protein